MSAEDNSELTVLKQTLDSKAQELHSATLQLNSVTANLAHVESENAELRNELDEREKDVVQLTELCQSKDEQIKSLQLRLSIITEEKEDAQSEVERCKFDMENLEENRKKETTPSKANCSLSLSTSFMDDQMSTLREEKAAIQAKLSEAVTDLQKYLDDNVELRQENGELKEEVECIQYQLSSQCQINERIRQELQELKMEEDSDEVPVVGEVKGNSLFSEVEDRRVMVERRMVKLQQHVRNMEENLTKEVKENERLKARVRQLRQSAGKTQNDELVLNTLHKLEESKKKVVELSIKLNSLEKAPQKATKESGTLKMPEHTSVSDKRFYGYMEGMMTQNKQEMEDERSRHESTKLELTHCDLLLTQKTNELIAATIEKDKLKARNFDLSLLVRDLQRKYEPERDGDHPLHLPPSSDQQKQQQQHSKSPKSRTPPLLPNDDKENKKIPKELRSLTMSKTSKSVGMREVVDIISDDGNHLQEDLKVTDGGADRLSSKNIRRGGSGTGKYKSISVASQLPDADDNFNECSQQ